MMSHGGRRPPGCLRWWGETVKNVEPPVPLPLLAGQCSDLDNFLSLQRLEASVHRFSRHKHFGRNLGLGALTAPPSK